MPAETPTPTLLPSILLGSAEADSELHFFELSLEVSEV